MALDSMLSEIVQPIWDNGKELQNVGVILG